MQKQSLPRSSYNRSWLRRLACCSSWITEETDLCSQPCFNAFCGCCTAPCSSNAHVRARPSLLPMVASTNHEHVAYDEPCCATRRPLQEKGPPFQSSISPPPGMSRPLSAWLPLAGTECHFSMKGILRDAPRNPNP